MNGLRTPVMRRRGRARPTRLLPLVALLTLAAAAMPAATGAASKPNAVIVWNEYAVQALTNPVMPPSADIRPGAGQTPTVSAIHLGIVQAAVYDAVNSIDRRYEPFLDGLEKWPRSSNKDAAAATAAHHVLVGIEPSLPAVVDAWLDEVYDAYIADLSGGISKQRGIAAGAAAAAAMLEARADDGRYVPFTMRTGTEPGQWRNLVVDPFGWVAKVDPLAIKSPSQFRTRGPRALTSKAYAREYNEVKEKGRATGSTRTAAEHALALFYTEAPATMFNRSFRALALDEKLSTAKAARFFAMVNVSVADATIGCWDDKEFWSFWRPSTAIQLGDTDGNSRTDADPTWAPLAGNPPYPDHPSGYNCLMGAAMHGARRYFRTDRMDFTLRNANQGIDREYRRFTDVLDDTIDARIWLGLHFRSADAQGAWLGRETARWVSTHAFRPKD